MEEKINNQFKIYFLGNIKSKYILQQIFANVQETKYLQIINYNKAIQKQLEKDINDYIKYQKIIIEIVPCKIGTFINYKYKEEKYYHIFFDDENVEVYRNYWDLYDFNYSHRNLKKIKIIID